MSSLRAAVLTATSFRSKHWCTVLSSPGFRNGSAFGLKKINSTRGGNFSSSASCLSASKDFDVDLAGNTAADSSQSTSKNEHPASNNRLRARNDSSDSSETLQSPSESLHNDSFQDIMSASRRIFSPSFGRDCQYRLISWQKKIKKAEKQGKALDLEEILSDSFPDVLEFSLTPLALPEVRLEVLKILLAQSTDNRHTHRMLQETTADGMQLPVGIVAEIVRLLGLAEPTELRVETRRALVMAVVNRRWYEVDAKHLVFFMFQMDELFDVKTLSKQLRQKSRTEEQHLRTSRKRNDRKGSKNTDKSVESKVEETVLKSFERRDGSALSINQLNETESTIERAPLNVRDLDSNAHKRAEAASLDSPVASVNMEARAIVLANELKVKDLARVVSLLSRWNSRNEPLLNVCLHRLSLADLSAFTPAQLANLLQAMATLSLHHRVLLENTTAQLSGRLLGSAPSPSQVCAILSSLSVLRWTGEQSASGSEKRDLISSCVSYLGSRLDKLTAKEAAGVLTSLASLSAVPSDDAGRAVVTGLASLVLDGKSPWWSRIHCVWCLSVLRCLECDSAQKVLDPQFVGQALEKVKESGLPSSGLGLTNKLAQINTTALLELGAYEGPQLSDEQLSLCCTNKSSPSREEKAAKATLANTLRKFVDLLTYVDLNPSLPLGVTADALMCANHEGEVRPLQVKEQTGAASTAEQTHRLAIQYIPFSGVNNPHEHLTGFYQMTARHLSLLGYTPVQIFYSDLKPSLSILEKVSNIKARIRSAARTSAAANTEVGPASTLSDASTTSQASSSATTSATPTDGGASVPTDTDQTLKTS